MSPPATNDDIVSPPTPPSTQLPMNDDVVSPPTPPSTQLPTNGDVVSPPSPPSTSGPTSEGRMHQERTMDVPTLEPSVDAVGEVTGERREEGEFYHRRYSYVHTNTLETNCCQAIPLPIYQYIPITN